MAAEQKRKIQWTICLFLVLYFYGIPTQAKYGGGMGEPNDPYLIYTAEQMNAIGLHEDDWDKHFILMADIDLSGFSYDAALIAPDTNIPYYRFEGTPFTGIFDGNGHTISHLKIRGEGFLGLFGKLESGAEVKDLGAIDVDIHSSHNHVGGLVAYNYGIVSRCYSTGTVSGNRRIGGLVGINQGCVTNCYSTAKVHGEVSVGGLIGYNNLNGELIHSYSIGAVSGSGLGVGGLVGGNIGYVTGCFWDTQTSGQAMSDGGRGLTTAEMMDPEILSLQGLGGDPNWVLDSGRDYPRLVWEVMIPEPVIDWLDGLGTPEDPFQIENADQLLTLNEYSFLWDKHFVLNADIDLNPNLPGRDIFGQAVIHTFEGSFVGNGHVILNLQIEGRSNLGFFRKLTEGSIVRDLGLENISVHGTGSNVGGLAGSNSGHVLNCYSTGSVTGNSSIGGLVGNNLGDITFSYSTCSVSADERSVGGLVGINQGQGSVTNCYSIVTVRGDEGVGGLVGWNGMRRTVTHCYSAGTVSGNKSVGGLLGTCSGRGTVVQCYSTCSVTGDSDIGGLVGYNGADVTSCYSTGSVRGSERVGGLMGHNWGDITTCYWDIETSGLPNMCGSQEEDVRSCDDSYGKTTAEMQMSVTFTDWVDCCYGNSRGVWTIDEGNDYPRLWWESAIGHVIEPTRQCLMHATNPSPPDGTIYEDTWISLSWSPGDCAASHKVYFGDNFDDVNDGTWDTFRGNRISTSYVVGLPGFAYSDGLVPGTTYYWRIDEVNNMHSESPWKGDVWSFTVSHRIAYNPSPPDGAIHEHTSVSLEWSPGDYAVSHDVYFGDNFEDVNNGAEGTFQNNQTPTSFMVGFPGFPYPDGLIPDTKYYWRIDEVNDTEPNSPWKGKVWSFTVPPKTAYNPFPAEGAESIDLNVELSWTPGIGAKLHIVYFGDNFDDVNSATGGFPQGTTTYSPGSLELEKVYYWRVDEYDGVTTHKGGVWSFTTANFIVVDDFESYNDLDPDDPNSNRIWYTWSDGYEIPANGSLVGTFNWTSWRTETVVHGGAQSMWYFYDNSVGKSEVTMTLVWPRNWTQDGVEVLSLWFYGNPANAPEPMYVALANANGSTAVVYHDNPDAALIDTWTEWNIDLHVFANQGVNLTNVNSITLGFGNRTNQVAGGSGEVWFDDIRLYRPAEPDPEP